MAAIEVWGGPDGRLRVELTGPRVTSGKSPDTDVVIEWDATVSRRHAIFEQVGGGWTIRDLGAMNGTAVNGQRLMGEYALHDGAEIQLGRTRVVFRDPLNRSDQQTERVGDRPTVTRRERQVLVELCRPLLSGQPFPQPATRKEIAVALYVGEPAVQQHLGHMYDKFGIVGDGRQSRRLRLANAALESGVITISDLRPD
jgi:pSer/pThr/pTyr-binding forkhead associated (FHA) protein